MPFGVDKNQGGDNPSNTKWMEECVAKVKGKSRKTGGELSKGEKIAICKAQLKRNKEKKASLNLVLDLDQFDAAVDGDLMDTHNEFMSQCINKMMRSGKTSTMEDAKIMCERELEANNFDTESAIKSINRNIRTD